MLAQLLCSFGATLLISYGISIVSGGTIFMLFDFAPAGMLLFCTTVMLVFSGLIKDFIFLPRKKTGIASRRELKEIMKTSE